MDRIAEEIEEISALQLETIADSIQRIGFTCTDCGACCRSETAEIDHSALVLPDEIRRIQQAVDGSWTDVARPMADGESNEAMDETFEWTLATDACGDCTFYDPTLRSHGGCSIYDVRPGICRTYPFQLVSPQEGVHSSVVDVAGTVRAYECEGLGKSIDRARAVSLAAELKSRALFELHEARSLLAAYEPIQDSETLVVHDSEGAKTPAGVRID